MCQGCCKSIIYFICSVLIIEANMLTTSHTQRRLCTGCKVRCRVGAFTLSGGKRQRRIRSWVEGIIVDGGSGDSHNVYFYSLQKIATLHVSSTKAILNDDKPVRGHAIPFTRDMYLGDMEALKKYIDSRAATSPSPPANLVRRLPLPTTPQAVTAVAPAVTPTTVALDGPAPATPDRSATAPRYGPAPYYGPDDDVDDVHHQQNADDDPEHLVQLEREDQGEQLVFEIALETYRSNEDIMEVINYQTEKTNLIGTSVIVEGSSYCPVEWIIRGDVKKEECECHDFNERNCAGLLGYDFTDTPIHSVRGSSSRINCGGLLFYMWPGSLIDQVRRLNSYIDEKNKTHGEERRKIPNTSPREISQFLALMMVGSIEDTSDLWPGSSHGKNNKDKMYCQSVDMSSVMSAFRFKTLRVMIIYLFADDSLREQDPWWRISPMIEAFNAKRKVYFRNSFLKCQDESMSAFRPRTSATGNLPHLSFIRRKPEPLGTELKTCACGKTGVMLFLEVQKGKEGMADALFVQESRNKTAACCRRMMHFTRRDDDDDDEPESFTHPASSSSSSSRTTHPHKKEKSVADSYFGGVNACLGAHAEGQFLLANVKTSHSRTPKKFLEEKMESWPAGSHLVLESRIEDVDLICVGYKYSKKKVMVFIFNKGASHTEPGSPYEAIWRNELGSYTNSHIPRPQCCAEYFKTANKVDRHNQVRQKELRLEKVWVTRCGYFRLFTTVFGITVTDAWLAYKWHMPSDHCHKDLSMEDFTRMTIHDILQDNQLPDRHNDNRALNLPLRRAVFTSAADGAADGAASGMLIDVDAVSSVVHERLTQDTEIKGDSSEDDDNDGFTESDDDGEDDEVLCLTQRRLHDLVKSNDKEPEKRDIHSTITKGRKKIKTTTTKIQMRTKRRKCTYCIKKTMHYCPDCIALGKAEKHWCCRNHRCGTRHSVFAAENDNTSDGE